LQEIPTWGKEKEKEKMREEGTVVKSPFGK
jgi:hypothetical protein